MRGRGRGRERCQREEGETESTYKCKANSKGINERTANVARVGIAFESSLCPSRTCIAPC